MSGDEQEIRRLRRQVRTEPEGLHFVPLAELLRQRGKHADAADLLRQGLQHHPGLRSARFVRARLWADQGRLGAALAELDELVVEDPQNISMGSVHIELLLAAGRQEDARQRLGQLAALGVAGHRMDGWRQQLEGRPALSLARQVQPQDPFLRPGIARSLEDRGQRKQARRLYERLIEVPEHRSQATHGLQRLDRPSGGGLPGRAEVEALLAQERDPAVAVLSPGGRARLEAWRAVLAGRP